LERLVDSVAKASADGYPAYKIEQVGEEGIPLTLGAGGLRREGLDVQTKDSQHPVVRAQQDAEEASLVTLRRGIAGRQFQRRFALPEGNEAVNANQKNGLLRTDMTRPKPEAQARTI